MKRTATVAEAVEKMIADNCGAVLISNDAKSLEGIFTERDLMAKVVSGRLDPDVTLLESVMNENPPSLSDRSSIAEAIHVLKTNQIRHLPVLNDDRELVGMISLRHLLYDHITDLLEEIRSLEAYFNDAPGG
jgi:CBS domain-containing protein